jgi:hypothetical protein
VLRSVLEEVGSLLENVLLALRWRLVVGAESIEALRRSVALGAGWSGLGYGGRLLDGRLLRLGRRWRGRGLERRLRLVVEPARGLRDRLGRRGGGVARLSRLRRLGSICVEVAARRTERLGLLAAELLLRRPVLALQLEVLLDGVVEQAHRAED